MPEYVMVKDKSTGAHYPVIKSAAESNPDGFQILKENPLDHNGDPVQGYVPENQADTSSKK